MSTTNNRIFPGGVATDVLVSASSIQFGQLTSYFVRFKITAADATTRRLWDWADAGSVLTTLFYNNSSIIFKVRDAVWATDGSWTIPLPSTGVEHDLVVTYDAGSTANVPVIYVDGVAQTVTTETAPTGSATLTASKPIRLGNAVAGNRVHNGSLSTLAIWKGAILTVDDALMLHSGTGPQSFKSASLLIHYPLDQAQSPEPDLIASNNATVTGTTSGTAPATLYDRRGLELMASTPTGACSTSAALTTSILLLASASGVCSTVGTAITVNAMAAAATCVCKTGLRAPNAARNFAGGVSTDNLVSSGTLLPSTSVSFYARIKIASLDANSRRIMEWSDASNTNFDVIVSTTMLRFRATGWSGSLAEWRVAALSTGVEHDILITYNGGSTANNPIIYVDGVSVSVTRTVAPLGTYTPLNTTIFIGNTSGTLDRCFDGWISTFAIWNGTILTAGNATSLHDGAAPCSIGTPTLYAPLNQGENPAPDLESSMTFAITGTTVVSGSAIVSNARCTDGQLNLATQITLNAAPTGACSTSASLSTAIRCAAAASGVCSTIFKSGNLAASVTGKASTSVSLQVGTLWTDAGFNFRATAGFVVDAAQEVPVIANFYPYLFNINGFLVTAGWSGSGPTLVADRDAVLDRRLAGVATKINTGAQISFQVKLPQAGNWRVSLALGDAGAAQAYQYAQVLDNGVAFATLDAPAGTLEDRWIAANGLTYDGTTWPASGATQFLVHGFTDIGDGTGLFTIVIGSPTPQLDSTTLAHLRLSISPDQGALLRASASGTCATLATITLPLSGSAKGICSTSGTLGLPIRAAAGAFASTTRTSLVPFSEQFENAAWTAVQSSVSPNVIAAPDGTVTADKLVEMAGSAPHYLLQLITLPSGSLITASIYAKAGERSILAVDVNAQGMAAADVDFDLIAGTLTKSPSSDPTEVTATMTDVGGGYWRCTVTWITHPANPWILLYLVDAGHNYVYTGDGTSGLYLWGFQFEVGAPASPYFAVTSNPSTSFTSLSTAIRMASVSSGVCATSAALTAVPRTLVARAGGSCSTPAKATTALLLWAPSAVSDLAGYNVYVGTTPGGPYGAPLDVGLLQPNVLLQSFDLTNVAWTLEGAVIHPGSPGFDGTLTGFELLQTVSTGFHRISQQATSLPAGTYTASIYLKAGAIGFVLVRLFGDAFHSYAAEFDLVNGLITPGSDTPYPGTTATITAIGNDIYRCTVSGLLVAGPASLYAELNNSVHASQYIGDASSSAFVGHPMIQLSAIQTKYLPTTTIPLVGYFLSGFTAGITYYFVATPYDTSLNEGDPSPEVSKLMPFSLNTAITLKVTATGAASTSVNLVTAGAIFLGSTSTCKASASATITAPTTLKATPSGTCSTGATLAIAAAASFASTPFCVASTVGGLSTAIALATNTIGVAVTVVRLSVLPALMASTSSCICAVAASLSAGITMASVSTGTASAAAALTTSITMASQASGICSTTPALSSIGVIAAASTGKCATVANFSTTSLLASTPSGLVATSATLVFATGQVFGGTPSAHLSTSAGVTTVINSLAAATGACSTAATLSSSGLAHIIDNVQERWAERGIERGIFGGGG